MLGKQVINTDVTTTDNVVAIDRLTTGVYIVQIQDDTLSTTQKLIKH
jgi:hypothetical protein